MDARRLIAAPQTSWRHRTGQIGLLEGPADVRPGSFATGSSRRQVRRCPLCRRKRKCIQSIATSQFASALACIARNLVEWLFNKIKPCRRIATRYDKPAANYLAFVKLAAIRIWLRAYESAPPRDGDEAYKDADTDSSSEQEQSPGVLPWFSNLGRILTSS
jgi:transposase